LFVFLFCISQNIPFVQTSLKLASRCFISRIVGRSAAPRVALK
jgi:hypothetical protein